MACYRSGNVAVAKNAHTLTKPLDIDPASNFCIWIWEVVIKLYHFLGKCVYNALVGNYFWFCNDWICWRCCCCWCWCCCCCCWFGGGIPTKRSLFGAGEGGGRQHVVISGSYISVMQSTRLENNLNNSSPIGLFQNYHFDGWNNDLLFQPIVLQNM